MINFFRKTLANENKFFKYSRYAIGEIFFVVFGILIAPYFPRPLKVKLNAYYYSTDQSKDFN
jgi:hypothetical protein